MSRLPMPEWWATYRLSNQFESFETGKLIFANSEVEAKKLALDDADENEILLSVERVPDGTGTRLGQVR